MNLNENVVDCKVVLLFKIYNFHIDSFFIRSRLQQLNFKFENLKHIFL
jgi:hypothetical protein